MKKILMLLYSLGMLVYLNMPFSATDTDTDIETTIIVCDEVTEMININEESEADPIELAIQEMQGKIFDISVIENKEQWFIAYKKIIDGYKDVLDPPLTVYDYYTDEEIYLIQRVVETECYDQDFISKVNAANVVFNRINSGSFGDTVEEVITKRNQFAYGRKNITESTILAVEYAFQIEDTTNGCVAFRSDDNPEEWYGWEYVFTDDAGHNFYREKETSK